MSLNSLCIAGMVAAFLWLSPSLLFAQAPATLAGRPTVTAVRIDDPPTLDGRLDDPVWRDAARVTDFVQRRPVEGARASENTEVHIAYDDEKIYFGIYAHYSTPSLMRASRVDRDQIQQDDKVTIYLDPFLDLQRAYGFAVNPYGVQRDAVLVASGNPGGDPSWNALYETAATVVSDGWTAELAIPFKSLRYPERGPGEPHRWAIQLERDIEGKNEAVVWSPVTIKVVGFITQMGTLEGLRDLSTSRNFELMPTVTAVQVGNLNTTTGAYVNDDVAEAGLNLKYGLTSNLTLDFTYNPDFSQIESDRPQIQVNLRFPVSFPELRPFFVEGNEIYAIPGPVTLVHTRTILDPRYGAKLSAKLGRTALALLIADDEAPGRVGDPGNPAFERSAHAVTARARVDLYRQSHVGAIFTDREFLDSYSRLGGIDGGFLLGNSHMLNLAAMTSDRRALDGTNSTGPLLNLTFRNQGRNVNYSLNHYRIHPDFGSDLGFVRRVDERHTTATASYKWWPESWIINWGPGATYERKYEYRGSTLQDETISGDLAFQFSQYINVTARVDRLMERYREVDFHKTRYTFSGRVNTSRKIAVSTSVNSGDEIRFIANPFLGTTTSYNLSLTLRPVPRLLSTIAIDTNRFTDVRTDTEAFDVKILHTVTTYQFTDRLLVRNILDYNSLDKTVGVNALVTYRVNAGTVFFAGYDDRYRQGDQIGRVIFPDERYQRTNRAIFTKLQYLFRR